MSDILQSELIVSVPKNSFFDYSKVKKDLSKINLLHVKLSGKSKKKRSMNISVLCNQKHFEQQHKLVKDYVLKRKGIRMYVYDEYYHNFDNKIIVSIPVDSIFNRNQVKKDLKNMRIGNIESRGKSQSKKSYNLRIFCNDYDLRTIQKKIKRYVYKRQGLGFTMINLINDDDDISEDDNISYSEYEFEI